MAAIRQLTASVVNKIAAGEVIERPASVVKELVENAIDAGARRIDVAVEGGGVQLVRVADDGCGIPPDELPLAVASHATSKISDADDLFQVRTLGFRGEALASIAEVSRLVLRSRTADSDGGSQLEVAGGVRREVAPCGCPPGTIVEIRDLFYNTPVRHKFLRTPQTEMGHTSEALARIALAHPSVHFTLRHNDRVVHDLPASDGLRERAARLFGRDLAEGLIWVESEDRQVRLSGYVAHPSHSRATTRMQYLFLNGRCIRDRALQHALGEAYRGLLLGGRHPITFLHLEMPPEAVDVNVHPTKLEVRFRDGGAIYSQLLATLRTKFLSTDLTTRVDAPAADTPQAAHDQSRQAALHGELVRWAQGALAGGAATSRSDENGDDGNSPQQRFPLEHSPAAPRPLELTRLDRPWNPTGAAGGPVQQPSDPVADRSTADAANAAAASNSPMGARTSALQIDNRYIITESDEGVLVIDQHALHERILYERLREKVLAGGLDTQALLVPEPVDLAPAEAAAVLGAQELLAELGVRVEAFGGDTVLVSSYPAMLANFSPAQVLRDLAERLASGERPPERRDLIDELLHMIACKAAIKAGDALSGEEISSLLAERHLVHDTHHCPHGRPTALVFTRQELDRRFLRK